MYNSKYTFPGVGSFICTRESPMDQEYGFLLRWNQDEEFLDDSLYRCIIWKVSRRSGSRRFGQLWNIERSHKRKSNITCKVIERVDSFIQKFVKERYVDGSSWIDIENYQSFLRGDGFNKEAGIMIVHKKFDKNCNVIEEMCRVLKEIFVNGLNLCFKFLRKQM